MAGDGAKEVVLEFDRSEASMMNRQEVIQAMEGFIGQNVACESFRQIQNGWERKRLPEHNHSFTIGEVGGRLLIGAETSHPSVHYALVVVQREMLVWVDREVPGKEAVSIMLPPDEGGKYRLYRFSRDVGDGQK